MSQRKRYHQKQNLNRFGRYMEALNVILDTTQMELARLIEMNRTSLSYYSRNAAGTSKEIVTKLEAVYREMAVRKHVALPLAWDVFLRETIIETPESAGASAMLEHLEYWAETVKERNQLRREITQLQQTSRQALKLENMQLREEVHELRERLQLEKREEQN